MHQGRRRAPRKRKPAAEPAEIAWTEGLREGEPTGRDRREAERVIAYWRQQLEALGDKATIAALDLAAVNTGEWANRFLIAVDPVIERSALLLYGPEFARLMGLREQPRNDLPLNRQLPLRHVDWFLRGCEEAHKTMEPVRLEGEIERADGRLEQYRAVFIPVRVKPNSLTCLAFGAFSNRLV